MLGTQMAMMKEIKEDEVDYVEERVKEKQRVSNAVLTADNFPTVNKRMKCESQKRMLPWKNLKILLFLKKTTEKYIWTSELVLRRKYRF